MIPYSYYDDQNKNRMEHPWYIDRGCPMPRPRSLSLGALHNRYVAWNELTQVSSTPPPPSPLTRTHSSGLRPRKSDCGSAKLVIAFLVIVLLAVASFVASFRLISRQVHQQEDSQTSTVIQQSVPVQQTYHYVPEHQQKLHYAPEHQQKPHHVPEHQQKQHYVPGQQQTQHNVPGQQQMYHYVPEHQQKLHYAPERPQSPQYVPGQQQNYHYVPEYQQNHHYVPEHQQKSHYVPEHQQKPHYVPEPFQRADQSRSKEPRAKNPGTQFQNGQSSDKTSNLNKNHQQFTTATENPHAGKRRKSAKTPKPYLKSETEPEQNFTTNSNSSFVQEEYEKVSVFVLEPAVESYEEHFVRNGTLYIVSHEDQEEVRLETVIEE